MTVEDDLGRLAAAVADAAHVRAGEVVLVLGAEDAGPLAVALVGELGRRGAVVRPWLHLAAPTRPGPKAEALTAALAARADVVVGLGVVPPAGPTPGLQVAVPSHATAQDAGRSLRTHAAALADAPDVRLQGASDG